MTRASAYLWPEALFPLRAWLAKKGVDVDALKSERQALWMARELGRQKVALPKKGQPTFPAMLKLQRSLCPNGDHGKFPPRREKHLPGTFGPASEVRRIDPADYLASHPIQQPKGAA